MTSPSASHDTVPLSPDGAGSPQPTELAWLHPVSDGLIFLAFLVMAAGLFAVLLRRPKDVPFPRTTLLFAVLALACGALPLLRIAATWHPPGVVEGLVKTAAAVLAVGAAATLCFVLSRMVALPSRAWLAQRRDAEARARASEARLTDVFHHMADAVFVSRIRADGSLGYETVNPAFERLFGIRREEVLGRGTRACLDTDPAATAVVERHLARALDTEAPVEFEASGFTRAGWRQWHTMLVPLRDEAGRVVRLLGSVHDVTETRRLQADLEETARLATIGSMCAGVTHEMSQPVNVVALWAGNARAALDAGRTDTQRLRRTLDVVLEQSRRIGLLLERMRDLMREGGSAPDDAPEPVRSLPFDACATVAGAVEMAGRQYAPEGIEILLDRPAGPVTLRGQAAKLEQALLQLLTNARDAIATRRAREPGAPARIVVALRADHDSGVVAIAVRDTGGGVPASLRGRVFDPFFTTKDPGHGTGLGLAIAQGVARSMGGRLETWNEADPAPERGAVFCMTLPLAATAHATILGAAA